MKIRYAVYPDARREVLKHLLILNHERYKEEVKQGLHYKNTKKNIVAKKKQAANASQQSLL